VRRLRTAAQSLRHQATSIGFNQEVNMEQRDQANTDQLSDELQSTSSPLPKRYIPWLALLGLAQFLVTIAIFSEVIAPYVGHEEVTPLVRNGSPS
jgi:hypothetical protein